LDPPPQIKQEVPAADSYIRCLVRKAWLRFARHHCYDRDPYFASYAYQGANYAYTGYYIEHDHYYNYYRTTRPNNAG
jgi:hypothetical protein